MSSDWLNRFKDWEENRLHMVLSLPGGGEISAVELPMCHNFSHPLTRCDGSRADCIMFEVMAFGPGGDEMDCARFTSWAEALDYQEQYVAKLGVTK